MGRKCETEEVDKDEKSNSFKRLLEKFHIKLSVPASELCACSL